MKKLLVALFLLLPVPAFAQGGARVVQTCGSLPLTYAPGSNQPPTVDINGNQCVAAPLTAPVAVYGAELLTDGTGTFTNATQTTSVTVTSIDGYGTALVSLNGTYNTATGVFELSDDGGTTWYSVQGSRINSCTVETGYTGLTNTNQVWTIPISGADAVRVRSTAVSSGTVTVRISISSAVPPSSTAVCGTITTTTSDPCTSAAKSSVAINVVSGTTTSLVAVSGTTTVYVCGFAITIAPSAVTAATAQFEYGTGAACTSPTVLTGTFGNGDLTSAAGVAPILYGTGGATIFKSPASNGICILTAGNAVSVQGVLTYVQQ